MNLNDLVIALKEKRKWEEATVELNRKLEDVERQIETFTEKLKMLELELNRMREMLHAEPAGKVEMSAIKLKDEVR
ncbi:MAG: hypothetical protein QW620_00760 [Thermoplasmata archaeon]